MKTWVLIAHRAGARLFEYADHHIEPVATLEHPASRNRDGDFQADRPGRVHDRHGPGRHAMSPEESPVEREAANFARELAAKLEDGRVNQGLRRIVLVAEPGFLGVLRGSLGSQTASLVDGTLHKDLADVAERDLPSHLEAVLPGVRRPSREP